MEPCLDPFSTLEQLLTELQESRIPYHTGLFRAVCDHAGSFLRSSIRTDLVHLERRPGRCQSDSSKTDDAPTAEPTATEETAEEVTVDGTAKKLYAPIQGTIVPRNEIPDDTFAAGVLGNGVGIDPEEGVVVAPFDGEISSVTDTKHAIGITGPADMEVLIHVGVDTVNMKGDGFELLVEEGQKVKAGQKLMTFDIAKIKAAGYSPVAAVLLTNSDDYPEFKVVKTGKTQRLEEVFTV